MHACDHCVHLNDYGVYIATPPETTMQIDSIGYSYVHHAIRVPHRVGPHRQCRITSDIPELSLEPAMAPMCDNTKDTTKSFIVLFYNIHEDRYFLLLLHTEPCGLATAVI